MNNSCPLNKVIFIISVMLSLTFAQDTTLSVTQDGKVGIGTTSPAERLVVGFNLGETLGGNRITIGNNSGASALNLGTDIDHRAFLFWDYIHNHLAVGTKNGSGFFGQTLVLKDGKIGSGTAEPEEKLDIRGNIAVSGTVDGVDVSNLKTDFDNRESSYTQYKITTDGYTNISISDVPLKTKEKFTFTKIYNDSKIEVYVNVWADLGQFSNIHYAQISIRINTIIIPDFRTLGELHQYSIANTTYIQEPISILAIFENLPAGVHEVSMWAKIVSGGGQEPIYGLMSVFGGGLIIKETW